MSAWALIKDQSSNLGFRCAISGFWRKASLLKGLNKPEVCRLFSTTFKQYSKTIPLIGKLIVGSDKPYKYLVKSIEKFYNQQQLAELILNNGFSKVEYRNLSNGISAIHSGWKI